VGVERIAMTAFRDRTDAGVQLAAPVREALSRLFTIPLQPREDGRYLAAAWCVLHDEQVHVALGGGVPTGLRTKQNQVPQARTVDFS
jgi:hypothetical protein